MGLENFMKDGYYTRVGNIQYDKTQGVIAFNVNSYDNIEGRFVSSILFSLTKSQAEIQYLKENPAIIPEEPVYPTLCLEREAMVPMWTDTSTDEEIEEYDQAKALFYSEANQIEQLTNDVKAEAYTNSIELNEYEEYFSNDKIFVDSNITECIYNYLKSKPEFEECNNV